MKKKSIQIYIEASEFGFQKALLDLTFKGYMFRRGYLKAVYDLEEFLEKKGILNLHYRLNLNPVLRNVQLIDESKINIKL